MCGQFPLDICPKDKSGGGNKHADELTLWRLMGVVIKAGQVTKGAPRNEGPRIAEGAAGAETWSMRKNFPDMEREGGQVP